jgi:putative endonuclease
MHYIVYILYSSGINRFYVGQTSNLDNRITEHNSGESPYTSTGIPWKLLWSTTKPTLRTAEDLEFKLKNLTRVRKIRFMRKYPDGIQDMDLLNSITPHVIR